MPFVIIGAAVYWIAGGAAATAGAVALKFGWDWYTSSSAENGLVEGYLRNGEDGFRNYAYENLGVNSKDEMDCLWAVRGPEIAGLAATAAVRRQNKRRQEAEL